MADTVLRHIPVEKIVLDLDNPRMYHHGVADADNVTVSLKDEEIMKDILESSELPELIKSIQSEGVRDAIYVIPQGDMFRVIGKQKNCCNA